MTRPRSGGAAFYGAVAAVLGIVAALAVAAVWRPVRHSPPSRPTGIAIAPRTGAAAGVAASAGARGAKPGGGGSGGTNATGVNWPGVVASGGPPAVAGGGAWAPRAGLSWQIQLIGAVTAAASFTVYDLDPFTTPAQTVAGLRAAGRHVMCHVDIGAADLTLPDSARLTGAVLGASAGRHARWLDIRQWATIAPVLADRLQLCADKGFDAVDADNGFGYAHSTGFDLTVAAQMNYDREVVALARRLRLAVGVRTTPALAATIEPVVNFAIAVNCFAEATCPSYFGYIDRDKAVFDVETIGHATICPRAHVYGFAAIRKHPALDAASTPC